MSAVAAGPPSRLGVMILLWLHTQPEEAGTRTKLDGALKAFLEQRWSVAESRRVREEDLVKLQQSGLIGPAKRTAFALTASGKRAGLAALGVEALPKGTTWRTVKQRYLLARALNLPPPITKAAAERIDGGDGMRAAILARYHQLDIGDYPTLKKVKDALAWRALGVKTGEPFTLKAAMAVLLNRTLGHQTLDTVRLLDPDTALEQLAAKSVGALRVGASTLQLAVLTRWLDGPEDAPNAEAREQASSEPSGGKAAEPNGGGTVEPNGDDSAFAARVLAAARASQTGRFGDDKVFISHVFRKLAGEGAVAGDAEAFKARLVSAHFQGLLSLSRADLVEAMEPGDVDASETQEGRSTFHFVQIEG